MTNTNTAVFLLTTFLGLSVVRAQQTEIQPAEAVAPASFTGLDRPDGHSRVGFRSSYILTDSDQITALGFELYGQYAAKLANGGAAGGYGHLPMAFVVVDMGDDESAVGNLELGGFYMAPLAENFSLVARGGLSLATADDTFEGFAANLIGSMARLSLFVGSFPDTTWFRLGASPIFHQGNILVRADIGLDFPIAEPSGIDIDTFINFNAGVGVAVGPATILLELVNIGNLTGDSGDLSDRFIHTIGAGAEFNVGKIRPRVALVLPLDQTARDVIDLVLTAGIEGVLD